MLTTQVLSNGPNTYLLLIEFQHSSTEFLHVEPTVSAYTLPRYSIIQYVYIISIANTTHFIHVLVSICPSTAFRPTKAALSASNATGISCSVMTRQLDDFSIMCSGWVYWRRRGGVLGSLLKVLVVR